MIERHKQSHERYINWTPEAYEKQGIMTYLCRMPADRKLVPAISQIKGKSILDVGLGTGDYTRLLINDNKIVGVDQNPHLCKLPIKVHKGSATELSTLVAGEKFDAVLSTWMTEYLSREQLTAFFKEARKVLANQGMLITTIISKYGFGFLYVTAAKIIRGIDKYNYTKKEVVDMLKEAGFVDIEIVNLSSRLYVPWAYLVTAK